MKGSSKVGSGNQEGKGPRAEVKPTSEPGEILLTRLFSFCALLKSRERSSQGNVIKKEKHYSKNKTEGTIWDIQQDIIP